LKFRQEKLKHKIIIIIFFLRMEFSKELQSALAAASSDKIPAPTFKELVEFTVAVLVGKITEDKISGKN